MKFWRLVEVEFGDVSNALTLEYSLIHQTSVLVNNVLMVVGFPGGSALFPATIMLFAVV